MFRRVLQLGVLISSTGSSAEHWAFQPLRPTVVPSLRSQVSSSKTSPFKTRNLKPETPLNPIDAYLQTPANRADARTLIRRAHFDLTGLPPSDVSDTSDLSDEAYARLIDSLLSSPHYGEQWARHWLDVARYSDTKGYVYAREEKNWVHASAYRDWVVRALNENMPYDRFLLLQIAADQVVPPKSPDLAAMGFLTLGRRFLGVTHDIIDDRIDTVMRGTQALTVSCARCHDHKFDPIPTRDYYALYGVFQSCAETLVPCASGENAELDALVIKNRDLMTKRREEQMKRTRDRVADYLKATKELDKYPEEVFGQLLDANDLNPFIVHRFVAWLEKHPGIELTEKVLQQPDSPAFVPDEPIANIEMYFPTGVTTELWKSQGDVDRFLIKTSTAPAHATILKDRPQPVTPRVFTRGNPLTKAEAVPRQFLSLFGSQKPFSIGSGRLELAQAIIDPRNPLTARVMVNRLWQHHFGKGLVSTPSDFGKQGSPPTHPELLDFLAAEFIRSGWSMKHMHRLIMLSEAYRGSSITPHRLSFEEARDAWLAAAGRLNPQIGGRPEPLFAASNTRRTLYAFIDRENLPAVMRTFDFANPDLSIPQRSETTVPQQALFGLNHPFLVHQAKALVKRTSTEKTSEARIGLLYRILFQRSPKADELASALAFISVDEKPVIVENDRAKAWQHGFGEWNEKTGRVKTFTPLPHFTGHAWQGAEDWPNATLGWAQLTAEGGHPGNDRQHAVVRRWTAPATGKYDLRSTLIHEPKVGDGIRAFVSHSRLGKLLSTKLHGSQTDLSLTAIAFQAGDTLDFITDIGDGLNSDQFLWSPQLIATQAIAGSGGDTPAETWDAKKDFSSQPKTSLTAWEQLAQVLMLSNEFMFVD